MVLAREGGSYRVLVDGREYQAVLRGKARRGADRAVAGDRVLLDPATTDDGVLAIEQVEPRTSLLARRVPDGRGTRPIAANVDQVVVMVAAAAPDPVLQLIDRLLLVAEVNDLPACVLVNKVDLAPPDPICDHLHAAGYPVLPLSVRNGDGLAAARAQLAGRESVLAGASGVGKSSLLNAIEPGLGLRVGALSSRIARGRHTTVTATMVPLATGGFVVDTPGFSDVGVWGIEATDLSACFPEMREVAPCRYGDCQHREEPGCAVREEVASGGMPPSRYQSYRALWEEVRALPPDWDTTPSRGLGRPDDS